MWTAQKYLEQRLELWAPQSKRMGRFVDGEGRFLTWHNLPCKLRQRLLDEGERTSGTKVALYDVERLYRRPRPNKFYERQNCMPAHQ